MARAEFTILECLSEFMSTQKKILVDHHVACLWLGLEIVMKETFSLELWKMPWWDGIDIQVHNKNPMELNMASMSAEYLHLNLVYTASRNADYQILVELRKWLETHKVFVVNPGEGTGK
jgi:hypothetical protein